LEAGQGDEGVVHDDAVGQHKTARQHHNLVEQAGESGGAEEKELQTASGDSPSGSGAQLQEQN